MNRNIKFNVTVFSISIFIIMACKSKEERFSEMRCAEIQRSREKGCPVQCINGFISTDLLCADVMASQMGQCMAKKMDDIFKNPLTGLLPITDCETPLSEEFGLDVDDFGKISDNFMLQCQSGDKKACDIACCHENYCQELFAKHFQQFVKPILQSSSSNSATATENVPLNNIVPAPILENLERVFKQIKLTPPETIALIAETKSEDKPHRVYFSGLFGDCSGNRIISIVVSVLGKDDVSTVVMLNLSPALSSAFEGADKQFMALPMPLNPHSKTMAKEIGLGMIEGSSTNYLLYGYDTKDNQKCVNALIAPVNMTSVLINACAEAKERVCDMTSNIFGLILGYYGIGLGLAADFIVSDVATKTCEVALDKLSEKTIPAKLRKTKNSEDFCRRLLNQIVTNFYCEKEE